LLRRDAIAALVVTCHISDSYSQLHIEFHLLLPSGDNLRIIFTDRRNALFSQLKASLVFDDRPKISGHVSFRTPVVPRPNILNSEVC
jgi:hypothetical protein